MIRICFIIVDFPDSPAPIELASALAPDQVRMPQIRTEQEDLDCSIHRLLVTFQDFVYLGIPLQGFLVPRIGGL